MSQANGNPATSKNVVHWPVKFLIGLFAGICAAFLPRLGAILTTDTGHLTVFPSEFVFVGAVFGVLVGGVMMILEYGIPRPPKETFLAALGVPALIAGALNTASNTNELKDVVRQQSTLTQALGRQLDIPILPAASVQLLPEKPSTRDGASWHEWIPLGRAFAADTPPGTGAGGFNPGIQVQQQRYVIILDEAKTEKEALARAKALRAKVPQAQAVRTDQGYLVIQGGAPRNEASALLEAVKIKSETQLQPRLLPVK
jgi:hypothetical protein